MSYLGIEFLIDIIVATGALIIFGQLSYIRFNFKSYIKKRKYKPGSIQYANIVKFSSVRAVSIALLIAVVMTVKSFYDARSIINVYGNEGIRNLLIISAFAVFLTVLIVGKLVYDLKMSKRS